MSEYKEEQEKETGEITKETLQAKQSTTTNQVF